MQGLIALDIDGTLTQPGQAVPWETAKFLKQLAHDKWQLVFITGRTFQFGSRALGHLQFPYYMVVQNGAITIEMPTQQVVNKKYLDQSIIPVMQQICDGQASDFVIYTGFEHNDRCYYRSRYFSAPLLEYLQQRTSTFQESWMDVPSFNNLDVDAFPSVKCFGMLPEATELARRIEQQLGLHVPLIRDPFNESYFVAQATHPDVSKGQAIRDLIALLNHPGPIIAAGDDYNDISMLDVADVKIVMATAPSEMLLGADIIAPSAAEHGIIAGLNAAIQLLKRR